MSLLLPDYSSSSEDETAPTVVKSTAPLSAPAPPPSNEPSATAATALKPAKSAKTPKSATKKKKKKTKTTLYLPPEIQKLLEIGTLADSDAEEEEDSLLAKQKRAVAKRPRAPATDAQPEATATLSFLPAPKHQLEESKRVAARVESVVEETARTGAGGDRSAIPASAVEEMPAGQAVIDAAAYQQYYQQQQYDPHQYSQAYQQYHQDHVAQEEEPEQVPSSKRARHRDRELERMLQMGQFDAVANKIVEVSAPVPDAWQAPPSDELKKGSASDVKVKASFWNSSAGTAVASVKPSRMQRQKHQLNQLAFDAKAREFELLDRKGAAIKTKSETHAKYGW